MNVVGKTTDGKLVVDGVFQLFASHGLPLTVLFMLLAETNRIPCWITLYDDALNNEWKHQTIISRLREALFDSYSAEWATVVITRLEEYGIWKLGRLTESTDKENDK